MPASRKRKGRGSGVPLSQRQHGSLEAMQARAARPKRTTDWGTPYEKPQAAAATQLRAEHPKFRSAQARRLTPKRVAIGAGVVGGAAGAGYLVHRHNQKKAAMSKSFVNPFEEVVAFGKAYPRSVVHGTDVQRVRALVPTGRNVGHANALTHVKRKAKVSGRATRLERYTGGGISQRVGPFGKAAGASVENGLKQIAAIPRPKSVPAAPTNPLRVRVAQGKMRNSNIPDGARKGSKL